jgi:thiol-disulfide isomerase/thioredoxin
MKPTLLDFMADWCLPCKSMGIILAELEKEYDFVLSKIDVDKNQHLASGHNVASIPTLILLVNKIEAGRIVGAQSKANILKLFEGKVQRRKA